MKIALTAGFNKSLPGLLMVDRLQKDGHEICAVVVVSPFNIQRARQLLLSRGISGVKKALIKMSKGSESATHGENPLAVLKTTQGLTTSSLKAWCSKQEVDYHVVKNINDSDAAQVLRQAQAELLVYCGGGILRAPIIESVNGNVINAHAGPLPEIRGMNAIEWATLLEERQAVTVHFIDKGIDTGRLIREKPIPEPPRSNNIERLRAAAVATGICALCATLRGLHSAENIKSRANVGTAASRQCYTMAPALIELLAKKLETTTNEDKQRLQ